MGTRSCVPGNIYMDHITAVQEKKYFHWVRLVVLDMIVVMAIAHWNSESTSCLGSSILQLSSLIINNI